MLEINDCFEKIYHEKKREVAIWQRVTVLASKMALKDSDLYALLKACQNVLANCVEDEQLFYEKCLRRQLQKRGDNLKIEGLLKVDKGENVKNQTIKNSRHKGAI